jgi:hypothetical protein
MSKNITEITKLAKQIADKSLASPQTENSDELLEALGSVAKLLEQKAGSNAQIKDLAVQVQELVKAKSI